MANEHSFKNYFRLALYLLSYSMVIYIIDWRINVQSQTALYILEENQWLKEGTFQFLYKFNDILGQIIAQFLWVYVAKYMTEEWILLIGVANQAVVYMLMSQTKDAIFIFALWFFSGLGQNMSCVGKSFVFDLVSEKNVQFFFSLKSISSIFIIGGLPLTGPFLLNWFGNFSGACLAISIVFMILTVLFFVMFIIFPKNKIDHDSLKYQALESPKKSKVNNEENDENKITIQQESIQVHQRPKRITEILSKEGIWETLQLILQQNALRQMVLVHILIHPLSHMIKDYNSWLLYRKISESGAGLSKILGGWLLLYSTVPIILFQLFLSKKIQKDEFRLIIRIYIFELVIALILQAIFVLNITEQNVYDFQPVFYGLFFAFGLLNQKLLAPFFNAQIGLMVTKSYKVSINAIVFISAKIIEAFVTLTYSQVINYLKSSNNIEPFYKTIPYQIIIAILIVSAVILK